MNLRTVWFSLLVMALVGGLAAQSATEQRLRLRHVKPSVMLDRIETLAGMPGGQPRKLRLSADDASSTLVIQIPTDYGDHVDRERLRLLLREYIARLDQPDDMVLTNLYIVHGSLLTEDEFLTIDRRLRSSPLSFPEGTTAKGVVFQKTGVYPALELIHIDESQVESRARTQPDPVSLKGKLLPSIREDGSAEITLDVTAHTEGPTGFLGGNKEIKLSQTAAPQPNQPLIIVGGQKMPLKDVRDGLHPGRYELMVYLWLQPAGTAATAQ